MPDSRLAKQLAFLMEADALKGVLRQSPIADGSRRENSAEHSWHLALFAMTLAADHPEVNALRAIAMLLLHDLVEIDAGDNPIHGTVDAAKQAQAEARAADRLFGLLPNDLRDQYLALWQEFEASESRDAQFAKALDRLQPLLLNTTNGGGTWNENHVTQDQVHARYGPVIERGSPDWWAHAKALVAEHFGPTKNGTRP